MILGFRFASFSFQSSAPAGVRGSSDRALVAGSGIAAVLIALFAAPASADFHIAHIERVLTGNDGSADVQFVEIVMDVAGQANVSESKLSAFHADGSFSHVIVTLNKDVLGGAGRPFIIASNGFDEETSLAVDFLFDSTDGKGMLAEDGMVCWGKPANQSDPDQYVDCVSYGDFTGTGNDHTSEPSPVTPFGHALHRVDDTHSSAADFECENPAFPRNNEPTKIQYEGSVPCEPAVCGDEVVQDTEGCDDGDTAFSPGDFCSAACVAFPCGIPTKMDGVSPKTSDALFILKAAVATSNCDIRVCDVNNSTSVTSSDALAVLKRAVGQSVVLNCPDSSF